MMTSGREACKRDCKSGQHILPAQAKIVDGHLLLDSKTPISLQIPYVPTTRTYALEMDFQIEAVTTGRHFGLTARNAAGNSQYAAQMLCTRCMRAPMRAPGPQPWADAQAPFS